MALPLLSYQLTTQNSRVTNLAGDSSTVRGQLQGSSAAGGEGNRTSVDAVIATAYRQIFFHALSCDREPFLESQLRAGNITTRDFIRGLLLSERFQQGYYQCSSNYRMVDQVVGRALGRPVHGDAERRAWSIVIRPKGSQHSSTNSSTARSTWSPLAMTRALPEITSSQASRPGKSRSIRPPATAAIGAIPCKIAPERSSRRHDAHATAGLGQWTASMGSKPGLALPSWVESRSRAFSLRSPSQWFATDPCRHPHQPLPYPNGRHQSVAHLIRPQPRDAGSRLERPSAGSSQPQGCQFVPRGFTAPTSTRRNLTDAIYASPVTTPSPVS